MSLTDDLCLHRWSYSSDGTPYEAINHSAEAVRVSQYMASFFVDESRRSSHRFADVAAELASLIYNYAPTRTSGSFVQNYYFPNDF